MEFLLYLCGVIVAYWVFMFAVKEMDWNVPTPILAIAAVLTSWRGVVTVVAVALAAMLYISFQELYELYTKGKSDDTD